MNKDGARDDSGFTDASVLDERTASLYLKITPELLYHYLRYGTQGRRGRKLPALGAGTALSFTKSDLDDYDAYLREPWSPSDGKRAGVPKGVQDYLKVESGGMCTRCGGGAPLEDAHIVDWETSRSNHHHNLIRLCSNCHGLYDTGAITREEVGRLKADAIERVQSRIVSAQRWTWPIVGAPPATPHLFGRKAELAEAIAGIRSGENLFVHGVGGIGKTQLVLHALQEVAPDRPVVWIGVDTLGGSSSVVDGLVAQASAVGVSIRNGAPLLDEARACVVFDGIERLGEDRDEISDLIEQLMSDCTDTLILITSQVIIPWLNFDRQLRLGPLDDESATKLLSSPSPSESASIALIKFAEGHPLTLRILSALITHLGNAGDVVERLDRLGAEAVITPGRRRQSERTSLIQCLDLAYSFLSETERRLLWIAAASPGGLRPALHDMERLVGPDPTLAAANIRSWNLIETLLDSAFEEHSPARSVIYMLSPIRAFVMAQVQRSPLEGMTGLQVAFCESETFLLSFIQYTLLQGDAVEAGKALMEREFPNAVSVFDLAADRAGDLPAFLRVVIMLANSTMMTFFTTGRFEAGQSFMRRASAAATRHGSLTDALQFLLQMQVLAERAFNREAAAFALAEAERLAAGAEGESLALLRMVQASSAECARDYERAATAAREAYDILHRLDGENGECRHAAFQLATALEFGGRPADALPFYVIALEAAEKEDDPINRGSTLHHIGNCEAYAGRWQAAIHAYRKAAEQFVELEAVEFISNALGEAGIIVPQLDPMIGLPSRDTIAAGLDDIVDQFELLFAKDEFGGRNPRVTFRKLGGIISLALHTGNRDLLSAAADEMYHRLLEPVGESMDGKPDWFSVLIFHTQWFVRLLQFLCFGFDRERPLSPSHLFVLAQLASNAFVVDLEAVSDWLASYLRRRCDMPEMTGTIILRTMRLSGDDPAARWAREQAEANGVDLKWLGSD